jgi:hypothetical protein
MIYLIFGEFDQKGTLATKYGTKEEFISAIEKAHENHIKVIADTAFNHKANGDEVEKIKVRKVNPENRTEFISEPMEIEGWTKFFFPGRNKKYSDFIWDQHCFSGIDWAENLKESGIFKILNEYGESWEKQRDYLDHKNTIGWTREGVDEKKESGCAVLLSNGDEGWKYMEIGKQHAGKVFVDCLGKVTKEITIDKKGGAEFYCKGRSVSVWVNKMVMKNKLLEV